MVNGEQTSNSSIRNQLTNKIRNHFCHKLISNFFLFSSHLRFLLSDPPEIVKRPANQAVRVGGVASFFCSARGDPVPSIVWRKNGKKVPGTQSRYSVTQIDGLSILRIEPVRAGRDDAPYECVAENGVGDAVSAEATLTVYEGTFNTIEHSKQTEKYLVLLY